MTTLPCPSCGKPATVDRHLLGGWTEVKCLAHGRLVAKGPTGAELRDEALERVDDPPWKAFAVEALRAVAQREDEFSSEDVWEELDRMGIPRPSEGRAMGPVFMAAVKDGSIVLERFDHATNPKHHAMPKRIYRAATREDTHDR